MRRSMPGRRDEVVASMTRRNRKKWHNTGEPTMSGQLRKPGEKQMGLSRWRGFAAVIWAALALGGAGLVWAVHDDNLFELDQPTTCTDQQGNPSNCGAANVADNTAGGMPDDWANIYCKKFPAEAACAGVAGDSAFATAFIQDPTGDAETSFFDQGGSKDEEPISTALGANKAWKWDNTNDVIPDKDDISNAFAAAYRNPKDGHIHFYFGADRFDTNGNAEMGFWFFRLPVTLGVKPNFNGQHMVGDILVLVNFVNGGRIGDVTVYRATAVAADGTPTMTLVADSKTADCTVAGANDPYCGVINNLAGETPPWLYKNKDGQSSYQVGALFEGGIDLTALFPGQELGCFSSFMAETRSSHSIDAQLKDFALGGFPVCGIDVTKTGKGLSKVGDVVDYTITVKNTGLATLYKKSILDSLIGNITNAGNSTCGASLAPNATCTVTVQRTVAASGDPDPLINTVTAIYTEKSDFTGVAVSGVSSVETNLFQPSITFAKSATPTTILQGGTVNYKLDLKNTSSSDTPDLTCGVGDTQLGISESVTLTPGASYLKNAQKVYSDPANQGCTMVSSGNYSCTNTATVTCSPAGWPNKLSQTKMATVTVIPANVAISVTKTAKDYSKTGDKVTYTIGVKNNTALPLTVTSIYDPLFGGSISPASVNCASLAPLGSCSFTLERTVSASDADPLKNTVRVDVSDGGTGTATASAEWSVDLIHPDFTVAKSCVAQNVPAGASVNFQIRIKNTGDVPLVLAIQDPAPFTPAINLTGVNLGQAPATGCDPLSGTLYDGNASDGCYLLEGSIIASGTSVTNTVSVQATLPSPYKDAPNNLANRIAKTASATCTVQQGGATRTPGFWRTHGDYACHVLLAHDPTGANLGWKIVSTCEEAQGVFWSSMAKNSDGSKRSQLCQATQQADFQLLSAILNSKLSNGKAVPIDPQSTATPKDNIIVAEQKALAACYDNNAATVCDRTNILRLKTLLDTYNNSGDSTAIVDNDGYLVKKADPRAARESAVESFADCK